MALTIQQEEVLMIHDIDPDHLRELFLAAEVERDVPTPRHDDEIRELLLLGWTTDWDDAVGVCGGYAQRGRWLLPSGMTAVDSGEALRAWHGALFRG